jgi:hypothetical protein
MPRTATIPEGPLTRVVAISGAGVIFAGLAVELIHGWSHADIVEQLLVLLSLSYEQNIPTWYATCLLFSCSIALGFVASRTGDMCRHWWGLCAVFAYLSLDEMAELHERLGGLFGTGGILYFDWVIPAAVVVAIFGAIYLPFLRRLSPLTRRRFVIAGIIYVTGALALELPLGYWTERAGDDNLVYAMIDFCEESLELIGAGLFLLSVVHHYHREVPKP